MGGRALVPPGTSPARRFPALSRGAHLAPHEVGPSFLFAPDPARGRVADVSVFNRRNAVVGWLALSLGKRVAKDTAKSVVPSIDTESKKPNKSAIALVVASAVGAATFWKKRSGGGNTPPPEAP